MKIHMKHFLYTLITITLLFFTNATFAMKFNAEATAKLKEIPLLSILYSTQKIEQLLKEGADPDLVLFPNLKETLLHEASGYDNHSDLVELLLEHGASHHLKNIFKATPLYRACVNGASKNIALLLQAGASIREMCQNNKLDSKESALAALLYRSRTHKIQSGELAKGYLEVAKILLDADADTINPANGYITHPHTNAELAQRLELPEFDLLFRKKIAEPIFNTMRELRQTNQVNYLASLPLELQQEVALFATSDAYKAKCTSKP